MIVCGFAGIGKTHLAKHRAGWVDLESTPFEKNWATYAGVAYHMSMNGFDVLLSCHEELRDFLRKKKIPFITVAPDVTLKEHYLERYKSRGNAESFIQNMDKNWHNYMSSIPGHKDDHVFILKEEEYLSYGSVLARLRGSWEEKFVPF